MLQRLCEGSNRNRAEQQEIIKDEPSNRMLGEAVVFEIMARSSGSARYPSVCPALAHLAEAGGAISLDQALGQPVGVTEADALVVWSIRGRNLTMNGQIGRAHV